MQNTQTYQEAFQYLMSHYEQIQGVGDFERKHVSKLSHIIHKKLQEQGLPFEKEGIRHALVHFYAAKGIKVSVVFDKDFRTLVRKQTYDLENNLYLDVFTKRLMLLKNRLQHDTKQESMLFLEYDVLSTFLADILDIEDEQVRVELIKKSIKRAFELGDNDAVLLRNDKIAIKCSSYSQIQLKRGNAPESPAAEKSAPPAQPSGSERRYEGLSPEEMESYFNNLNKKYDIGKLLIKEFQNRFTDELNLKKIDNFYFAKNFIRIFQKTIANVLDCLVDEDKVILQGLGNYILRFYFDLLLQQVAEKLIELLLEKDSNAIDFVKFYNGETAFGADGSRYTKPDILDDQGKRWNHSTIMQIAMQRRQGLSQIAIKRKELEEIKQAIRDNESHEEKLVEELNQLNKTKTEAEENAANAYKEVSSLKDRLVALKTEALKSGTEAQKQLTGEINELSLEIKKQGKKDEDLFRIRNNFKAQHEKIEIKIGQIRRERQTIHKKLQVEQKKFQQLVVNQEPLEQKGKEVIQLLGKTLPKFRV